MAILLYVEFSPKVLKNHGLYSSLWSTAIFDKNVTETKKNEGHHLKALFMLTTMAQFPASFPIHIPQYSLPSQFPNPILVHWSRNGRATMKAGTEWNAERNPEWHISHPIEQECCSSGCQFRPTKLACLNVP